MSDDDYVVEEIGGRFRVILKRLQYDPGTPYDEFRSPLIRLNGLRAEHIEVGSRPADDDARIEEAINRWDWGRDPDSLERFLMRELGATKVIWHERPGSREDSYVTYNSRRWREWVETPDALPSLAEYAAWADGEVYDYEIQKNAQWSTEDPDVPGASYSNWTEVDGELSTGGIYYGMDEAEEAAREYFSAYLTGRRPRVCADCGGDIRQGLWGSTWKHVDESRAQVDESMEEDHDAILAGGPMSGESTESKES